MLPSACQLSSAALFLSARSVKRKNDSTLAMKAPVIVAQGSTLHGH